MNDWKQEAERLRFSENRSWVQIAKELKHYFPDLDIQQVVEKIRTHVRRLEGYKTKGKVTFENIKQVTEEDVAFFYEAMKRQNAAIMKLETKQNKANINIDSDRPILLSFWGDWHLGAKGVDYEQMDKDIETLNNLENNYIIGMGDYKDNMNAFVIPGAVQEDTTTQDMQDLVVQMKFRETADKWIAIIRGCHEDFDRKIAGKDFIQSLCDITNSVNLWHGGIVNLTVGEVEYRIGARHKYKNESGLNTTNTQRNFVNEFGQCDIVGTAHKHFCELQHTSRMGEETIYLRSGTYKVYDEFGQKLAGYIGARGIPSCILYPDRKLIIPFKYLDDAVRVFEKI